MQWSGTIYNYNLLRTELSITLLNTIWEKEVMSQTSQWNNKATLSWNLEDSENYFPFCHKQWLSVCLFLLKSGVFFFEMYKRGDFLALNLQNNEELLVTGKVLKVDVTDLSLEYWRGGSEMKWRPWKAGGQVWRDKLPKACVLLLDKNNMLPSSVVEELKELYGSIWLGSKALL